jgi:hypothetical protein
MTYGDVVGWAPPTDPAEAAVDHAGASVPHAELHGWAGEAATAPAGARQLLTSGPDRGDDLASFLRTSLAVLVTGGSLVVTSADLSSELDGDPSRLARLRESERVTAG